MCSKRRRRVKPRLLVEYATIVIFMVTVSAIAIGLLGTQLGDVLSIISDRIHE